MKDAASKDGNAIVGLEDEIKRLKAKVRKFVALIFLFKDAMDIERFSQLTAFVFCRSESKKRVSRKMRTRYDAANKLKAILQPRSRWLSKMLPALWEIANKRTKKLRNFGGSWR